IDMQAAVADQRNGGHDHGRVPKLAPHPDAEDAEYAVAQVAEGVLVLERAAGGPTDRLRRLVRSKDVQQGGGNTANADDEDELIEHEQLKHARGGSGPLFDLDVYSGSDEANKDQHNRGHLPPLLLKPAGPWHR